MGVSLPRLRSGITRWTRTKAVEHVVVVVVVFARLLRRRQRAMAAAAVKAFSEGRGRRRFALAHMACSNTHQISQRRKPPRTLVCCACSHLFLTFFDHRVLRSPGVCKKTIVCEVQVSFCIANTTVGECCLLIGVCLRCLRALQPTARAGGGCAAPVERRPLLHRVTSGTLYSEAVLGSCVIFGRHPCCTRGS